MAITGGAPAARLSKSRLYQVCPRRWCLQLPAADHSVKRFVLQQIHPDRVFRLLARVVCDAS